jgi:hypothetical protein
MIKLYTEEQVRQAIKDSYLAGIERPIDFGIVDESIMKSLTPIELPSDDEIEKQSEYIAHNYFDMYETNHYRGLKEGAIKMGEWMRDKYEGKSRVNEYKLDKEEQVGKTNPDYKFEDGI